jgi:hypothetical protein
MWKLLRKRDEECRKVQDSLEESPAACPGTGSQEDLVAVLPPAARNHMAACEKCREAAQDFFAVREILKDVAPRAEGAGPWFASRVMRAIEARERELGARVATWVEVPRFASRLAWIAAILLLAGSTWLYERAAPGSSRPQTGAAAQESIFETPPPTNQDDVLISMAESNR